MSTAVYDGVAFRQQFGALTLARQSLAFLRLLKRSMRITSKGQVTIPHEIRERAGLLPNTVEFELRNNVVTLKKSRKGKSRGQKIVERLRGTGKIKMTTDEILRLTRGDE
jgi:AbrB family looped-hinge helix DNA binding protein